MTASNAELGGDPAPNVAKMLRIDYLLDGVARLAWFNEDQAVILRGDEKSEYQKVLNVLNTCQKAGIWNVSFATRPPEQTPEAK